MVKLRVPDGVTAVSHSGRGYDVDPEGHISVEHSHVRDLLGIGFVVFAEELSQKETKAKSSAEELSQKETKAKSSAENSAG